MAAKNERVEVRMDAELHEYLRQKSLATGAPISELCRRAISMARNVDQEAGKQHATA